ncbi:Serine/threonine-protein kinase CTR1 [Linum grandiflorum]
MAFDHNLAKDLRLLNVGRPVINDSRIALAVGTSNTASNLATTPAVEYLSAPEGSIPVAVADSGGFVGVGYRNVTPFPAVGQLVPVVTGNVNTPAAIGFSVGNRVVGNNGVELGSSEVRGNANGSDDLFSPPGYAYTPNSANSEDGGDGSASGKKVKLLCSFGGKILPRPSDGALRYVGGQTRIISVRREATFGEVMQKMVDTYGQPVVIKYQLPGEDLDALVSVSCPEDLDNMLDEYEKLVERASDGSAKLRVFLFSSTELDASSMVQLVDTQDSGQQYVAAVNGISDGVISRKGSMASATSTQNSDVSGAEAADISGEASRPPSVGGLSPRVNSVASQDTSPRLLSADHNPPSVSLGIPLVQSASPPALLSPHEVDYDRPAPVNVPQQHMDYNLPQAGIPLQSNPPYMHAYRDPRQEMDYLHIPPQMLATSGGPVFTQRSVHDVSASMSPHHYIPAMHMPMAPSSPLAPIRPNMAQPLMQAQHSLLDHYADGTRIMQVPVDPSYNTYRPQMQPAIIGGWRQVLQPDHVVYSDGMMHHQQQLYPEKPSLLEDCLMCQKALPHAHSDPVVQDQSPPSLDSVYHSLHLEDSGKVQGMNRVMMAGGLGESTMDQGQVISGDIDQTVGTAQSEAMGLTQSAKAVHVTPMNKETNDHPKMSVPLGMMGLPGDSQSHYGVLMGTMPQSRPDDTLQQHAMETMYGGKQDIPLNMPLHDARGLIHVPESRIYESPKAHAGNPPHVVSKENMADFFISQDHLKPVDDMKGASEINLSNECNTSVIDQKSQQEAARELLLDNSLAKAQVVPGVNHLKPEILPAAEFGYVHSSQPVEPYNVAQSPYVGDPGAHLQSMVGDLLDSRNISCVNQPYVVEPVYQVDRVPPVSESNNDISRLLPNTLIGDMESLKLSGDAPSSVSPAATVGGFQESSDSLFSNQDPWNLRHDTHFPPPKPLKIATRENHLDNAGESLPDVLLDDGISQTLCGSEHTLSSKGSEDRLIKQELQAVAEGVAASVFKSDTPSTNLTGHEGNESHFDTSDSREVPMRGVEMQHKAKAEDLKNKQQEKVNMGVPMSEGAGRLQIIKSSDLEELKELGSGTFGTVYHGKWRGTDVAIKRINDRCFAGKPSEQERMIDDFWNEAIKLADLHHPNVVAFYGVVLDGPGGSVATVTEYMVNGSLRNALQKNERGLEKRKRLLIAMDVAFGMEYLHGKNIVHFDLKSDNLLVNLTDPNRPICKVGDLGLSKVKCQTLISGGVRGTLPWMAPELLNGSSSLVSEKVDVFSFGIVLWELLTGEEPYADLHYGAIIGGIVSNTLRPPVPESCDLEWKTLMERCWSSEPSERPSFTGIANDLRAMAAKIPSRGHTPSHQQPSSAAQPHAQN